MLVSLLLGMVMTQTHQPMGNSIEYRDGDVLLEGYVSKPMQDVVAPIVIVVHQWGGLGEYEKQRCDMLAQMGYVAFAADIYGKGVRPTEMQARAAEAQKYKGDRALYRSRLTAALTAARKVPGVYADKVSVIGYCFGGTGALEVARMGADVRGVVSFHGGLDGADAASAQRIKTKVLVLHGADDPFVPAKDIEAFAAEMRAGKVDWQMVSYGNAVHSFTEKAAGSDNSRGAAYNADADRRSWRAMQDFLHEVLK